MPVQLFNLRGVDDDEADEIRDLLSSHGIDYYETPGGNWGISLPAIWLRDETQLPKARMLLEEYQAERSTRMRAERERLRREGRSRTILDEIREHPVRFVVYLAVIALVLYLSTRPFLELGD